MLKKSLSSALCAALIVTGLPFGAVQALAANTQAMPVRMGAIPSVNTSLSALTLGALPSSLSLPNAALNLGSVNAGMTTLPAAAPLAAVPAAQAQASQKAGAPAVAAAPTVTASIPAALQTANAPQASAEIGRAAIGAIYEGGSTKGSPEDVVAAPASSAQSPILSAASARSQTQAPAVARRSDGGSLIAVGVGAAAVVTAAAVFSKPFRGLLARTWNALLGIFGMGVKKMETPEIMAQRLIDQLNAAKPVYNRKVQEASTMVEKLRLQIQTEQAKVDDVEKTITAVLTDSDPNNDVLTVGMIKEQKILKGSIEASNEQLALAEKTLDGIKEERSRFFADREEMLAKINAGLTKAKAAEIKKQMAELKGGFQVGDLKDNMDKFEDAVNDKVADAKGAEDSVNSNPDEIIKKAKDSLRDKEVTDEIARRKKEIADKAAGNGKTGGKLGAADKIYFGAMGVIGGIGIAMLSSFWPVVVVAGFAAVTLGLGRFTADAAGRPGAYDLMTHEHRSLAAGLLASFGYAAFTGVVAWPLLLAAGIAVGASLWHQRQDAAKTKANDGGLIAEVGIGAAALIAAGAIFSPAFRGLLARAWNALLGIFGMGVKKMETPEIMAQRLIDQLNAAKPVYNRKVQDASTLVERLKLQVESQEKKSAELETTITALLSQTDAEHEKLAASIILQKKTLDASTASTKEQVAIGEKTLDGIKEERSRFFADREEMLAKINAGLTKAKAAEIKKQMAELKGGFQVGDLKDNMDKFEDAVNDKVADAKGAEDSVNSNPDEIIKKAKDQMRDKDVMDEIARRKKEIADKAAGNGKTGGKIQRSDVVQAVIGGVLGLIPVLALWTAAAVGVTMIAGLIFSRKTFSTEARAQQRRNLLVMGSAMLLAAPIALAAGVATPLLVVIGPALAFITAGILHLSLQKSDDGGAVRPLWSRLNDGTPFGSYREGVKDGKIVRMYGWSLSGRTFFQSVVLGLVAGPIVGLLLGSGVLWGIFGMAAAPIVVDLLKPTLIFTNEPANRGGGDGGAVLGGIGSLAKRFWNALLGIFGMGVKKMETPEIMAQRLIDQLNAAKPVYNRKVQEASTMVEKLRLQIQTEQAKVDDLEKTITAILTDSDPNNDVLTVGMIKEQKILKGSIDSSNEQLALAEKTLDGIKEERSRFFADREEMLAKINAGLTKAKAAEIKKQMAELKGGFSVGDMKDNMDKFEDAVNDKVADAKGAEDSVNSNPDEIIKKAKDSLRDKEVTDEIARRKKEIADKAAGNGKSGGAVGAARDLSTKEIFALNLAGIALSIGAGFFFHSFLLGLLGTYVAPIPVILGYTAVRRLMGDGVAYPKIRFAPSFSWGGKAYPSFAKKDLANKDARDGKTGGGVDGKALGYFAKAIGIAFALLAPTISTFVFAGMGLIALIMQPTQGQWLGRQLAVIGLGTLAIGVVPVLLGAKLGLLAGAFGSGLGFIVPAGVALTAGIIAAWRAHKSHEALGNSVALPTTAPAATPSVTVPTATPSAKPTGPEGQVSSEGSSFNLSGLGDLWKRFWNALLGIFGMGVKKMETPEIMAQRLIDQLNAAKPVYNQKVRDASTLVEKLKLQIEKQEKTSAELETTITALLAQGGEKNEQLAASALQQKKTLDASTTASKEQAAIAAKTLDGIKEERARFFAEREEMLAKINAGLTKAKAAEIKKQMAELKGGFQVGDIADNMGRFEDAVNDKVAGANGAEDSVNSNPDEIIKKAKDQLRDKDVQDEIARRKAEIASKSGK